MRARTIALIYHDVLSEANSDSSGLTGPGAAEYKLSADEFGRHLNAIASALPSLRRKIYCKNELEALDPAPVLLTFDDGGVSTHRNIAPMLETWNWRGYLFAVMNMIRKPGFMDADQIRDLDLRGHIIGSHSASHPTRNNELQ